MKKLAWLFMFISLATAGAIKIDVDQLRSPDHTKIWTPPAATTTLIGTDTSNALTNKSHDKIVITSEQVNAAATGANAVLTTPTSTFLKLSNASLTSIDGITAPGNNFLFVLHNKTGAAISLNNETGVNTTFRIVTGTATNLTLADDASVLLQYSTTYSRWYVIGGSGGGSGSGLSSWITAHPYLTDEVVIESNKIYKALSDHTSGTFATDLAGGKWAELSTSTIALTGDVTGSGTDSFATTIGAGKVTNTMLAGSIDLTTKVTGTLPVGNGGTGNTTGTATAATVTDDATTNATMYPLWAAATSGSQSLKLTSTKFNFNPSTGRAFSTALTLGTFTGASSTDAALDIFGTTNAILHAQNTGAQSTTGGSAIIGYAIPAGASMLNGNRLAAFVGGGSIDTSGTLYNATSVESFATENWSGSGSGAKLRFQVTPNATTSRVTAVTIDHNSNVAIGTSAPNANAILDVQSTTKGALSSPRMTTAQRTTFGGTLGAGDKGMRVYDTDLLADATWNGTNWQFGLGNIQQDNVYSALVSSTGVVSNENKTGWLSGNCTVSATSTFDCPIANGLVSAKMNCVATPSGNSTSYTYIPAYNSAASTNTNAKFYTTNSTNAVATAVPFIITCQKSGADYQSSSVFSQANAKTLAMQTTFSAYVTTTTGVITAPSKPGWISGCTAANPTVCTLNGFTQPPACTTSGITNATNATVITALSASSVTILSYQTTTGGNLANVLSSIICQKTGVDYDNALSPAVIGVFDANNVAGSAGFVNSPGTTKPVMFGANLTGLCTVNGNCSISKVGTGVTATARTSVGVYDVTHTATTSNSVCHVTINPFIALTNVCQLQGGAQTTTSSKVACVTNTGAPVDEVFSISCLGESY